ncbi:hypothetical protein PR048_016970 [Dryococelus australis]|uniref:Uncharacterized protein n=1 Tax=Dryococelus australis TaxID=614101 RepID=A0ABQ9H873_9NEOP|nr:hypothetical protein PR048_016970 [Dryococelus australis]
MKAFFTKTCMDIDADRNFRRSGTLTLKSQQESSSVVATRPQPERHLKPEMRADVYLLVLPPRHFFPFSFYLPYAIYGCVVTGWERKSEPPVLPPQE